MLVLAVPAGLTVTAASAATGSAVPTAEEAGYQFTGAQFRYAPATVYLRNASQYSASIGGLGQSVQFWGGGDVYVLTFTVNDLTTHTSSGFALNIGTGVSFKEVRVGSEFDDTPWSAPPFTAPASQLEVAAFSGGRLTNYKGKKFPFSGYFTTSPLIMTGPGSGTEANAGALNSTADGFSTFLVP